MCLPKGGNGPAECEDAFRVAYPDRRSPAGRDAAHIALSDGASESAFARDWANILAEDLVHRPPDLSDPAPETLARWLEPAQAEWRRRVPWERLPWHGEAKARAGALAALLGLTIARSPGPAAGLTWQALAIGDSCLFLVREERLEVAFPIAYAGRFNDSPAMLCSNPAGNRRAWRGIHRQSGNCRAGDTFILASDALACWFLERRAAGERPWQTLSGLMAQEPARQEAWVQEQRRERRLRNDDTTLLIIRVRSIQEPD